MLRHKGYCCFAVLLLFNASILAQGSEDYHGYFLDWAIQASLMEVQGGHDRCGHSYSYCHDRLYGILEFRLFQHACFPIWLEY